MNCTAVYCRLPKDKEMASYSALKSRVTEITTCSICLESFKSPRSLPCLHSFCIKCLEGHCKDKSPGDNVPCPLCRKEFQIPQNGLDNVRANFFLEELLNATDASSVAPGSESCEVCSIEAATFCCIDCTQKLCEGCSLPHKKMRGGPHDVKPLGAELSAELVQQSGSYCDKHPDKRLELYCFYCKVNICMKCYAVSHRQHRCEEINKVAKDFAASMKSDVKPFPSRITNYRSTVTKVEDENKRFLTAVQKIKLEMQQSGDDLKIKVDRHVSEMLRELEEVESSGVEEVKTLVESYNLAVAAMERFQCYSSELSSKGSPCDIAREGHDLHVRANKLLQTYNPCGDYQSPDIRFMPTDFDKVTRNIVGSLQRRCQRLSRDLDNCKSSGARSHDAWPLRYLGYWCACLAILAVCWLLKLGWSYRFELLIFIAVAVLVLGILALSLRQGVSL